jgi:hypothetical protein
LLSSLAKKIITNLLEFDHVVRKCSFIFIYLFWWVGRVSKNPGWHGLIVFFGKNCTNELTIKEIMVIFSTFKQFPWIRRDIRTPETLTIVDSCKTTSIVITISSHADTPKPRDLIRTMAKVSIEFCKDEAAKTKSLKI